MRTNINRKFVQTLFKKQHNNKIQIKTKNNQTNKHKTKQKQKKNNEFPFEDSVVYSAVTCRFVDYYLNNPKAKHLILCNESQWRYYFLHLSLCSYLLTLVLTLKSIDDNLLKIDKSGVQ